MTEDRRFRSTIMCNGIGEFQYIKIKDKKYSDNHLTYHISSDNDLDYLCSLICIFCIFIVPLFHRWQ